MARAISHNTGWPLLTLDTIKEAFFAHLGTGDREYNRELGKASYRAIFALTADFPDGATVVVDAWFGFQPFDVLQDHLVRAGITQVAEIGATHRERCWVSATAPESNSAIQATSARPIFPNSSSWRSGPSHSENFRSSTSIQPGHSIWQRWLPG